MCAYVAVVVACRSFLVVVVARSFLFVDCCLSCFIACRLSVACCRLL